MVFGSTLCFVASRVLDIGMFCTCLIVSLGSVSAVDITTEGHRRGFPPPKFRVSGCVTWKLTESPLFYDSVPIFKMPPMCAYFLFHSINSYLISLEAGGPMNIHSIDKSNEITMQ